MISTLKKHKSQKTNTLQSIFFFTSALDDSLFSKLTRAQVRAYISSLKELNLLVYLQEGQLFHTEDNEALRVMYSPLSNPQKIQEFLTTVAFKLSTVFSTIGEMPLIRYDKGNSAAKKLGRLLKERMEELDAQGLELGKKLDAPADERTTILIVSRSYDLVAPLLHEFTYQAMLYDLLNVDDKHCVEHVYTDNAGNEQTKKVVMNDESDQLWTKLRHMHIADTSTWVVKNFNDFIAANKKAGNLEMGKTSTLKEMGEAMRSMPQYQDMKSKYAIHIELVDRCMNVFREKKLKNLGMLEQDLVMGVKRSKFKRDLGEIFDDEVFGNSDKLRLLLIYLISQAEQGKLTLKDKGEVVVDAGYPPDPQGDHKVLKCLEAMGVKMDKDSLKEGAKEAKEKAAEEKKQRKKDKGAKDDEEATYELSRYTPKLKRITESLLKGELPTAQFPYVVPPVGGGDDQPSVAGSSSKAKWGGGGNSSSGKGKEKEGTVGDDGFKKGRVVVFVLGGCCYSELRSVYELTHDYQREVILGSTSVVTPKSFLSDFKSIKK
mmetsp:Transcript_39603/g.62637  ORF Transcript_39603/g.62637 Transcript_39603/m.62637 type:complete len:545 (-) Transcript_39603:74-1708(-)